MPDVVDEAVEFCESFLDPETGPGSKVSTALCAYERE